MAMQVPKDMKDRARDIKGFVLWEWRQQCKGVLLKGCFLKFEQNEMLAKHLLSTQEIIAEASPNDRYWGIGLGLNDPRAGDPSQWKGENVMGQILMEVRGRLQEAREDVQVKAVSVLPLWTREEIQEAQKSDPDVLPVLNWLNRGGDKPEWTEVSNLSEGSKFLLRDWDRLLIRDGLLRRKTFDPSGSVFWYQLILPRPMWEEALEFAHDTPTAGHNGVKRTLTRLKARFWWPKMEGYTTRWVAACQACQRRKGPQKKAKAPMQRYVVGVMGERIASDLMGPFSETDRGARYVMVIIDYFTKYAVSVALPDMTAISVCNALLEHWIAYFGVPRELHTDQGTQYEGAVMHGLCKLLGIVKTKTTSYRPQGDGLAERLNKTLCDMLNCVGLDHPFTWDLLW